MTPSSYRTIRWGMLAVGLLVGTLLLANGNYLLGAVIGGFAVVRLVLMLSMQHRRRQFRSARDTAVASGAPPVLQTLARGQFEVAAGAIGLAPSELRIEFANGRSIAEVAGTEGVAVDTVVAAVVADATAKVDRAVADGQTPVAMAARIKRRLPQWASRLVHGHRGELRMQVSAFR